MATTPNYGWVTPAPTDFVTDLPADFETFADAVDADLAGLLGGTTGQVLTKNSATDHDFAFADLSAGGMTLLATINPNLTTAVSFTSIPTTYKHLLLTWDGITQSTANASWNMRLNNDSTSIYDQAANSNDYDATTLNGSATNSGTSFGFVWGSQITTIGTDYMQQLNGYCWIYGADLADDKLIQFKSTMKTAGTFTRVRDIIGTFRSSTAISQIDFIRSGSQTISDGAIRLYGVN